MEPNTTQTAAGWREKIDLPEWGIRRVRAKLDTGARSSAIDVAQYEIIDDQRVRFEIVYRDRPTRKTKWIETQYSRMTNVKPSSGEPQSRVMCKTTFRIGDQEFESEIGLVCRKGMLCRMLIGRSALADRFVVDSSRKYIVSPKVLRSKGMD
ncbi:MAG: RimK/LysX family protein [Phycisphaerales bacterium]|nr:RimK/LysX family protein [Phycisphaerales bacterium]